MKILPLSISLGLVCAGIVGAAAVKGSPTPVKSASIPMPKHLPDLKPVTVKFDGKAYLFSIKNGKPAWHRLAADGVCLVGCQGCDFDGCTLSPGETTVETGTGTVWRCMDYDKCGTGRCLELWATYYNIKNAGDQIIGDCVRIDCRHGLFHGYEDVCFTMYPIPGPPDN